MMFWGLRLPSVVGGYSLRSSNCELKFLLSFRSSLLFLGPPAFGRRYVSQLAGLLGPAAAAPPWSGPSGHCCTSLGLRALRTLQNRKNGPNNKKFTKTLAFICIYGELYL